MTTYSEHSASYGNGKKIAYIEAGPRDGPLLIFVHGWPAIAKTWKYQLEPLAALGFRVVAIDTPGYGNSTVTRNLEDYSLESMNAGLLAVLASTGEKEAVWIGHDWGCGMVWSFVEHHPEATKGAVGMAVPSHVIELGLEELVKTIDRSLYPKDQYPFGQWDYQKYYEESFEKSVEWYEKDLPGFIKAAYRKGSPSSVGKPAMTSNVRKDGGWMGGIAKPPSVDEIPFEGSVFEGDEALFHEVSAQMVKTGLWAGSAYYMNHARNRAYTLKKWANGGKLHMPVLFIEAQLDTICYTAGNPKLMEPMRKHCPNLTEVSIQAGHWVQMDRPAEVNSALTKWLLDELPDYWPYFRANKNLKAKLS